MTTQRAKIESQWSEVRRRLEGAHTSLMGFELRHEYWTVWTYVHRMADYLFWIEDTKLIEEEFKSLTAYKDKELTDEFILESHNKYFPKATAFIEQAERHGAI